MEEEKMELCLRCSRTGGGAFSAAVPGGYTQVPSGWFRPSICSDGPLEATH